MAIKLVQGTCPLELANALAQSLAATPPSMAGVFDKVEIGVPDIGVGRWLSRRIAMANGICGDIGFPFTSALVFQSFFGSEDTPDPWSRDALCWTILAVLPDVIACDDAAIGPLRDYLVSVLGIDASALESHLRTQPVERVHWALAREITELFDDYITYRPHWCRRWNSGEEQIDQTVWPRDVSTLLSRNLGWQRPLWDACRSQIGSSYKLTSLSDTQGQSDTRTIRLFMPANLSPLMLHALTELGRKRSVEIYLLSHGQPKWDRIRNNHRLGIRMGAITREVLDNDDSLGLHPLRASCGRVELDTALLSESIAHTLDWVGETAMFEGKTVLARLQQAIAGHDASDVRVPVPLDDDSIQFHSCHGARRQVEVLRDTLLHLFERYDGMGEHEALQPRHVNVLVSDLEAYAPLIEAVFSQGWQRRPTTKSAAQIGAPKIEIAMVGRSFRNVNSVADALLRLLDLAGLGERMSASDVMGLLSLPPVLARFGLTGEDLAQIQTWIDQTGIRWGMDGEHRSEVKSLGDFGAPGEEELLCFGAVDANAWVLGLERLLLGVVLADDGEVIFDDEDRLGLIPIDDMEGSARTLVGRFTDAVNTIMNSIVLMRTPYSVGEWVDLILGRSATEEEPGTVGILHDLTATPGKLNWLTRHVHDALTEFSQAAEIGLNGMDAPRITVDALKAMLANAFDLSKGYEPTPMSSVTFAGLNSYSRVPSPIVALLGFDGDAFPRSPNRRQFDGVALTRRVGDIDPADTDRARFLDALMLAERHFIVLYSGRDIRTNARRAPSVVIGEVMDAIDDAFEGLEKSPGKRISASESLTIEHPLQAFSPLNFQVEGKGVPRLPGDANGSNQFGPWSYDPLMLSEAEILADSSGHEKAKSSGEDLQFVKLAARLRPPAEQEREVVHLDELIRFFKDPASEFLRRQLQMYFPREDHGVRDRESIRLNSLEQYALKAQFTHMYWHCDELSWEAVKNLQATRRIQTMGTLPWGPAGTRAMKEQWGAVSQLFEDGLHKFTSAGASFDNAEFHREKLDIDVPAGVERTEKTKLTIVGDLGPIWGDHLVKVFPGKVSKKRTIEVWLNALFWSALTERKQATVWSIYTDKDKGFKGEGFVFDEKNIEEFARPPGWTPQPNIQSWARSQLLDLLDLYLIGRERPIPLFLESSQALCWSLRDHRYSYDEWSRSKLDDTVRDKHNSAIKNVTKAWFGSGFDRNFDLAKPAVKVLYRDYLPVIKGEGRLIFEPQFYAYSRRLWRGAYEGAKATAEHPKLSSARRTPAAYKPDLSSITMGGSHA